MTITIETSPNGTLLRLAGDLRLWGRDEQEQRLVNAIRTVGKDLRQNLVLSLAAVSHVDSAGIGSLVRVPLECARRNVQLRVILPGGIAGQAIRWLRVFERWPNYEDEAAALQSMTAPPRFSMSA